MLQLLQPVWLFSLAGISVPVIIHLWNQRPGKTLKVGSIALVSENEKEYRRRWQLADWLLLLLRCLLIAFIAFALTRPTWQSPVNANKQKGWILLSKQNAATTYNHFKPVIDSLIKAGFEFHSFAEGFAKISMQELMQQADNTPVKSISYRALVASLDEQVDSSFPLYLFTDNYLAHFGGTRPAVSLNLHWFSFTPDDTVVQNKAVGDTVSFHVTLFADRYKNDLSYLAAAIDAIRQFSKKNIILTIANNTAQIRGKQDWLFWLSDLPTPPGIETKNLLAYKNGKIRKMGSWINEVGKDETNPVQLYQSVAAADTAGIQAENIWQDGFGNAILSVEKKDSSGYYYHCYTHFDPAWNELPWSSSFPAMIYELLEKNNEQILNRGPDKRIIARSQLLPEFLHGKDKIFKSQLHLFTTTDITGIFWLCVFILFFVERLVSFQYQKIKSHD